MRAVWHARVAGQGGREQEQRRCKGTKHQAHDEQLVPLSKAEGRRRHLGRPWPSKYGVSLCAKGWGAASILVLGPPARLCCTTYTTPKLCNLQRRVRTRARPLALARPSSLPARPWLLQTRHQASSAVAWRCLTRLGIPASPATVARGARRCRCFSPAHAKYAQPLRCRNEEIPHAFGWHTYLPSAWCWAPKRRPLARSVCMGTLTAATMLCYALQRAAALASPRKHDRLPP